MQRLLIAICCGYVVGQIVYDLITLVFMIVDEVKAKRSKKK